MANNTNWLIVTPLSGETGQTPISLTAITNNTLSAKTATISAYNATYNVTGTTTVTVKPFEPELTLSRSTIRFDRTGGTATFTVYSNTAWTITYPSLVQTYSVSAGTGDTEVTIALGPNTDLVSKVETGIVRDSFNVNELYLTIVQEAFINELTVTPDDDIIFANTGSSSSVTIDSNCEWEIVLPSWVTASTTTGASGTTTVTFTAGENGDTDRTGQIIVYYGSKEVVINVSQPFYIPSHITVTPSSYQFPYCASTGTFVVDSFPEWTANIITTGETVWTTGCYVNALYNIPSAMTMNLYSGSSEDVIATYCNAVKQYSSSITFTGAGTYKIVYELSCGGRAPVLNKQYITSITTEGNVAPPKNNYAIAEYNVTSTGNTKVLTSYNNPGSNTYPITAATLEDGTSVLDQLKTNWSSSEYYRAVQFPRTGKQTITYWYSDDYTKLGSQNTWHSVGTLTRLELGAGIKELTSERPVAYNGSLSAVTFNGLTKLSPFWSFLSCGNLKTMTCKMGIEPVLDSPDFQGPGDNGTLYYPIGSDYSNMLSALNSTREGSYWTTGWTGVPTQFEGAEDAYLCMIADENAFEYEGGTTTLSISSSTPWKMSINVPWLTSTNLEGPSGISTVSLTISQNSERERVGKITVTNKTSKSSYEILQYGGNLSVTPDTISTNSDSLSTNLTIISPLEWTLSGNKSWVSFSQTSGPSGTSVITCTISSNIGFERSNVCTLTNGLDTVQLTINQEALPFAVTPASFVLTKSARTETLTVSSPTSWYLQSDADWVTFEGGSTLIYGSPGKNEIAMYIAENETGSERDATISGNNGYSSLTIPVVQKPCIPIILQDNLGKKNNQNYTKGTDFYTFDSGVTVIDSCGYDFTGIKSICHRSDNSSFYKTPPVASFGDNSYGCLKTMTDVNVSIPDVQTLSYCFGNDRESNVSQTLTSVTFTDTDKVTYIGDFCYFNRNLKEVHLGNLSNVTNFGSNSFNASNVSLTGFTVDALPNINLNVGWQYCPLSVDSLVNIFNALPKANGGRAITIGSTNKNKLSAAQLAIATNKGWTVN